MKRSLALVAALLVSVQAIEHKQLDEYIRLGIKNSPTILRDLADRDIAKLSKKEMAGNFMPDITLHSRYTVSQGGRTLDFPIGDLLNPVYDNLEELNGEGAESYPQLENEKIPLLPSKDHETKVRVTQPIFNMDIINGYRISKVYSKSETENLNGAINRLSGKIRIAYFTALKAKKVSEIFSSSLARAKENLRVAEKLYSAGSATRTAVLASRTSLLKIEQQVERAEKSQKQAREYFNMILNRELDTPINYLTSDTLFESYRFVVDYEKMEKSRLGELALQNRFEVQKLNSLRETSKLNQSLELGRYIPSLSGVLDAGFTGDDFEFTEESDIISGSLVMQWNLFSGLKRKKRVEKAKLEIRKVEHFIDEQNLAIKFEVEKASDDLYVARSSYEVATKRAETAENYFEEVKKLYMSGAQSYNDFLQAESDYTQADMNKNITEYEILIAASNLITALGINDYYLQNNKN